MVSFIPGFCEVVFLSFSVISRGSPASLVVVSLCVFCLVSSPPMKVSWVSEGSHGVKLLLRSFVSLILLPMVNGLLGCMVVFSFGLARLSLQSFVSLFLPPMVDPGCRSVSSAWWMGSCPRSILLGESAPPVVVSLLWPYWVDTYSHLLTGYGYSILVVMVVLIRSTAC